MSTDTLFHDDAGDFESHSLHRPVLLSEALALLQVRPGGRYIDATFGGGGHTRTILEASEPNGTVLALDADREAVSRAAALGERHPGRVTVRHANFAEIAAVARETGFQPVDGVLLDLGLSSFQLASPERGFSFRSTGPLDMRFNQLTPGPTAADIVNTASERDLAQILFSYGEEPKARRIARAIAAAREAGRIETTAQLAALVERAVGGRRGQPIHPTTRTFQALRIAVNRELDVLRDVLQGALDLLAPGGRLVVISFHSLEDRIVKTFFRTEAQGCVCPPGTPVCICGHQPKLRILTPKPIRPSEEEQALNPRSRSALLRAAERLP
jgi:16S rRNA (cytosine1402-N4)-methyltransferase